MVLEEGQNGNHAVRADHDLQLVAMGNLDLLYVLGETLAHVLSVLCQVVTLELVEGSDSRLLGLSVRALEAERLSRCGILGCCYWNLKRIRLAKNHKQALEDILLL